MRFLTLAEALLIAEAVTGISTLAVAAGLIDVEQATEWIDKRADPPIS